jgi:hypothetical protein
LRKRLRTDPNAPENRGQVTTEVFRDNEFASTIKTDMVDVEDDRASPIIVPEARKPNRRVSTEIPGTLGKDPFYPLLRRGALIALFARNVYILETEYGVCV